MKLERDDREESVKGLSLQLRKMEDSKAAARKKNLSLSFLAFVLAPDLII